MDISPNSSTIACGTQDGIVRLFDAATGNVRIRCLLSPLFAKKNNYFVVMHGNDHCLLAWKFCFALRWHKQFMILLSHVLGQ